MWGLTMIKSTWRASPSLWRLMGAVNLAESVPKDLISLRNFNPSQQRGASHAAPSDIAPQRARVLDGRSVAAAWQDELAVEAADIKARGGRPPGLGVILVGNRADSLLYVTRKQEACERAGVLSVVRRLPGTVSQAGLRQAMKALCADAAIDGVLVQLPLPGHIDEEDIIEHFDPGKDVDGFHPLNVGRTLMRGRSARFVSCTALGCVELLRRTGIPMADKTVAIVGDSNIVGMPLAMLFRDEGASTVTVVHRSSYSSLFSDGGGRSTHRHHTETAQQRASADACLPRTPGPHHLELQPYEVTYSSGMRSAYVQPEPEPEPSSTPAHLAELADITRTADILVVAVGYPQLVRTDWIKPGAVVIDVGINAVEEEEEEEEGRRSSGGAGKNGENEKEEGDSPHFHVVGDVDFEGAVRVASAVTPVPGGVGPMTIAALIHNTVRAAAIRLGLRPDRNRVHTALDLRDPLNHQNQHRHNDGA